MRELFELFVLGIFGTFILLLIFATFDWQPFKRLYYTRRRLVRIELAELDVQIERYLKDSLLRLMRNRPGVNGEQVAAQARSKCIAAQASLARGDVKLAKIQADEGFDLLASVYITLKMVSVAKRFMGGTLAECSLLEHYKSGKYKP